MTALFTPNSYTNNTNLLSYHVTSNFYLIGSIGAIALDNNAYQANASEQLFLAFILLLLTVLSLWQA
ncbi:MAG: hypothetical protein OQK09_09055 [Colwellia sp.]|nr:hypothetical protein [Colwellia sp.]MCW8866023.1 hypothetical protein [Colwellia sp.]MCW9081646.1 hypothetical protein [Colwellia sp.]